MASRNGTGPRRTPRMHAPARAASPASPSGPGSASSSDAAREREALVARVRASGLKVTPQRLAIVRELAGDPTHPTAQEIFERLRAELPTMSFATVYNTLDALASAGLCAALSLAPGASRFDPNMGEHHHAVCDRCGLVRDVAVAPTSTSAHPGRASRLDEVSAALGAPGFQVRVVEQIYRGLCASCARERASAEA